MAVQALRSQELAVSNHNRFEVLSTSKIGDRNTEDDHMIYNRDKSKKNTLLCWADSHGRGMALHLNDIKARHKAVGFGNQEGGRTKQDLNIRSIDKDNLSKDDVLVIMTGFNDIAKNESKEMLTNLSTI